MILDDVQEKVIQNVLAFMETNEKVYRIAGSAGTGKSTIVYNIIDRLFGKQFCSSNTSDPTRFVKLHPLLSNIHENTQIFEFNYILCATTNPAAIILSQKSKQKVNTIHSVLRIRPDFYNSDVKNDNIKFQINEAAISKSISVAKLLIIDEGSMLNKAIVEYLYECPLFEKIIILGDTAQLPPIGEAFSSAFKGSKNKSKLDKVYRTGEGKLLDCLTHIRRTIESGDKEANKNISIREFIDNKTLVKLQNSFEANVEELSPTDKFIAYTNKKVNELNNMIRERLFQKEALEERFIAGKEIVSFLAENKIAKIKNRFDYKVLEVKKEVINLGTSVSNEGETLKYEVISKLLKDRIYKKYEGIYSIESITQSLNIDVYTLYLESIMTKEKVYAYVLDDKQSLEDYLEILDLCKNFAEESKTLREDYFNFKSSIFLPNTFKKDKSTFSKTIEYAYAITSHSSQGATYDNVYVDISNIYSCKDVLLRNRLMYVALSRAKKTAYIF